MTATTINHFQQHLVRIGRGEKIHLGSQSGRAACNGGLRARGFVIGQVGDGSSVTCEKCREMLD